MPTRATTRDKIGVFPDFSSSCFWNLGYAGVSCGSFRSLCWDSTVIVFHVILLIILFWEGMDNDGCLQKKTYKADIGSFLSQLGQSLFHFGDSGRKEWERGMQIKKKMIQIM